MDSNGRAVWISGVVAELLISDAFEAQGSSEGEGVVKAGLSDDIRRSRFAIWCRCLRIWHRIDGQAAECVVFSETAAFQAVKLAKRLAFRPATQNGKRDG
jgi:hypothetical protein